MSVPAKLVSLVAAACVLAVPATAAASIYNSAVLSDNPTLYWQLDETSGVIADNAATLDGLGDGLAYPAVLGAPGAFLLSPHGASLSGLSAITAATAVQSAHAVELWVKPTSAGSGTFLTYGNQFELGYTARRTLTLSVAGGPVKDTRVGLPLNRWTLVDVSLNTGAGADAQVFTNGGTWRVKTVSNVGSATAVPAGAATLSGAIGGVDELATFPSALTRTQALAHYTSTGLPISTAPPTVSGTPRAGQTVTATAGSWSANGTSTGFQWQRCDAADPATNACDDLTGATGGSYLVQATDVGSYLSVTESAVNNTGAGVVDSVAIGPVIAAPVVNPGTGTGTGTGTTTSTTAGTGTNTTTGTGTSTTTAALGCTLRLSKVKLRKANVKGIGRLTVKVAKPKGGKVKIVVKASKATKKRLAKMVVKLDRKTLKRMHGKRLHRTFKLKKLKAGKHALKLKIRPRHGKRRTVKLTLRMTCR